MSEWAEQECRIACKKENPNFNFESDEFDYGCSCYKSALKAYKALCDDGHSGYSFSVTRNILNRLMEGIPLTPITDEDFPKVELDPDNPWNKEMGLKSDVQCPRMFSLFRQEALDGTVTYHDNDRAYYINIEEPSDTYQSSTKFIDDMFPITMPYMPKKEKYQIYAQTFLANEGNGDFDTKGIFYVITPEGEKIDVNIFMTEKNNKMERITKEEYDELLSKRIDKLSSKVANHLIWTLISNSGTEDEITKKEAAYSKREQYLKDNDFNGLRIKCQFFENPENYKYNTFSMIQALCKGKEEQYKDIPELVAIAKYLSCIMVAISDDMLATPSTSPSDENK